MSAEVVQPETRRAWRDPLSVVLAVVLCLPALVPLLVIAHATLSPEAEVWAHLSRYVLPEVTINTIKLLIGVALLSGIVGTALAWLTSICEFPGRRFFRLGAVAAAGHSHRMCSRSSRWAFSISRARCRAGCAS